MSKVSEKLRRKRGSPTEIEGETYHVRTMTRGEWRRWEAIPKEPAHLRVTFQIGCTLCEDAGGQPEFPKLDAETDAEWVERIAEPIGDMPDHVIRALDQAVAALMKLPKQESIAKNSDETAT